LFSLTIPASAGQSPVVTFEEGDEKQGALLKEYDYRPFVGYVNKKNPAARKEEKKA